MKENNIAMSLHQIEGRREAPPISVETTTLNVAVAAADIDENPINGNGDEGGEGDAAEDGVDGESREMDLDVTVRRKRGRPRKHYVESLSPTLEKVAPKRRRGRPPGTGKRHLLASSGGLPAEPDESYLAACTITVQRGEDILEVLSSFSQTDPLTIFVFSVVGSVSIVDLRPTSYFGSGVLRYEGHFQLIKLAGSCTFTGTGDGRRRIGDLSVLLANPDGSDIFGPVVGSLVAAEPSRLVVGFYKPSIESLEDLQRAESSSDTGGLGRVRVPTTISESVDVVDKYIVTPPSPSPEPPDGDAIMQTKL